MKNNDPFEDVRDYTFAVNGKGLGPRLQVEGLADEVIRA